MKIFGRQEPEPTNSPRNPLANPLADPLAAAVAAVREQSTPDAEAIAAAAERAWARVDAAQAAAMEVSASTAVSGAVSGAVPVAVSVDRIRGCADVQALLPTYVADPARMTPARALLVEDHTRECIPCRRALLQLRAGAASPAAAVVRPTAAGRKSAPPRWLLAASLIGVVVLGSILWQTFAPGGGALARVENVDGQLFRVAEDGATLAPVAVNSELEPGEAVRTGRGAGAVLRLADGSRIEMRERSELALTERRDGATVTLLRGDVIIEAAKQGARRHLGVTTDDCVVSVVGTVFTVGRGTKGSRVGVLEGEVRVARGRETSRLLPGDQFATHASLRSGTLADDVAWSRDAERHLERVRALTGLGRDLGGAFDRVVAEANLRSSTALLDLMPAGTLVYAGLPNLAEALDEAQTILRDRLAESPALQAWWDENLGATGDDRELMAVLEDLRQLGGYLGPEIALGAAPRPAADPAGAHTVPELLALSEVVRPGFEAFLREEIARLNQKAQEPQNPQGNHRGHLRLIADPSQEPVVAAGQEELLLWLDGDILAAAPGAAPLRALQALRRGGSNPFVGSPFHARLAAAYAEGAGWLLGADIEGAFAVAGNADHGGTDRDRAALAAAGFSDARHVVVERKESNGLTESRLALTFDGPRHGVASWLAAPGPMGSLDFVSPEAHLYAGFLAKSPAAMVEDLLAILAASDPGAQEQLADLEAREGFDLRADLAAPLGGEIAFALDGPYLPTPSWKLIAEVYDAARLQAALERLVTHLREQHPEAPAGEWSIASATEGGREFFTLQAGPMAIHYLFDGGYVVAAPSRALLVRAVQYRATGYSLAGSERFTNLLPQDGEDNFSALLFQDLGGALGPLMGLIGGQMQLSPSDQTALEAMATEAPATLVYAYGEEDRILAGTRGSAPWSTSLGSLLGIASTLQRTHHGDGSHRSSDAPPATAVATPAARRRTIST